MKVLTNNQYLFFGEVNRSELYGRVLPYTFEFYVLCMIKIYVKIQFIMFYFLLILYSKKPWKPCIFHLFFEQHE